MLFCLRNLVASFLISGSFFYSGVVVAQQPPPPPPPNQPPPPASPIQPPPNHVNVPWWQGWESPPPPAPINFNNGNTTMMACGYDAQSVWRVLPLYVAYQYNGIQYNVSVINAWNPWTDAWDRDLDVTAFNTNYVLRNVTYNFYVVLSFGIFYFNL